MIHHLYRIDVELSAPLTDDQMEGLARALDDLVLGNVADLLDDYRGTATGSSTVFDQGTVSS